MKIDGDAADKWPRFELVTFLEPTGIPNRWDAELLTKGAPKAALGYMYRAARELTLIEAPGFGPLVRFGSSALYHAICLDPRAGAIVQIGYMESETANLPQGAFGHPTLVNSSLDRFIASVRAIIARFPYDSSVPGRPVDNDEELDALTQEWERAADEMQETLYRIDPAIREVDGFWETFLWDVRIGDFSINLNGDRHLPPET